MSRTPPKQPLIAIIGATGTGKSQLAVELATRFNGEIINGDAMQMYEGLPIITNKIPVHERKGIPHHLLGTVGLDEEPWRVSHFRKRALESITDIRSRGRLPIVVGGTHYYTQSLLFEDAILDAADTPLEETTGAVEDGTATFPILSQPTPVILNKLREVDPVMADRWHPNDRRKIQRSMEIYLQTKRKASDIYEEQARLRQNDVLQTGQDATAPTGTRFPTLVLWCHASSEILKARLDRRVDKMMSEGLLSEVETLHAYKQDQERKGVTINMTRGIWASIGYKEFERYLSATQDDSISTKEMEKLRFEAIEQTKAATRQYAKKQTRWIRIKLLNSLSLTGTEGRTFLLQGDDVHLWQETVEEPATGLVRAFLEGCPLPSPATLSPDAQEMLGAPAGSDLRHRRDLWTKQTCDVCGTVAMTEQDWMKHINSRKHRLAVKRRSEKGEASTCQETR
ncbi:MAG: hypothetical protein M1817_006557 [Caeruleum heppii]|nr:MAG: hypothetical protein M1817_006557 [Caeruleum heppii]